MLNGVSFGQMLAPSVRCLWSKYSDNVPTWRSGRRMPRWAAMTATTRTTRLMLAISFIGALATGCSQQHTSTPTTTTTQRSTTTTTTVALPVAPQPNAQAAADALINSWATGNRPQALSVATAAAVTTLFAAPYANGLVNSRGCNSNPPIVCAYGPPGGSDPSDPLYQLQLTNIPTGWYVSSVQIDN